MTAEGGPSFEEMGLEQKSNLEQKEQGVNKSKTFDLGSRLRALRYEEKMDKVSFNEGLAVVHQKGKAGFISEDFREAISFDYSNAENFSEGLAAVAIEKIKKEGNFSSKEEEWGFIDKQNNRVVEPQYMEVKSFSEGLAAVKKDNKWNYIDKTGKIVISCDTKHRVTSFKNGSAWITAEKGMVPVSEYRSSIMSGATKACKIDTVGNVLEEKIIKNHDEETSVFGYDDKYEPAE